MHSIDTMAPWQIAPVSLATRIASTALVVLSLDSVLVWPAARIGLAAAALTIIPAIIAIRLIRGFAAVPAAATVFVATQLGALLYLVRSPARGGQMTAALTVAIIVATAGLAAIAFGWVASRRRPVIALTRTAETRIPIRVRNA